MRFEQFIIMSGKLGQMRLHQNRVFTRKPTDIYNRGVGKTNSRNKNKRVDDFFNYFINQNDCNNGNRNDRKLNDGNSNQPKSRRREQNKRKILYVIKGEEDSGEMVTACDSPTMDGNISPHDSDKDSLEARKSSSLKLIRYSRSELLKIGESPYSQEKHHILDDPKFSCIVKSSQTTTNSTGVSKIQLFNSSNQELYSSLYPKFGTRTSPSLLEVRIQKRVVPMDSKQQPRVINPRDRIRKDQDIVLSPQRRSFTTGCFVTNSGRQSPSAKPLDGKDGHRDLMNRKIGSGRILPSRGEPMSIVGQSWMPNASEFSFRSTGPARESVAFERRFSRDFERDKDRNSSLRDKDRNSRFNNNNNSASNNNSDKRQHRLSSWNEPDEPEWYSGGPTSQSDTIELHGFEKLDDNDNERRRRRPGSQIQREIEQVSTETRNSAEENKKIVESKSTSPVELDSHKETSEESVKLSDSGEAENKEEDCEKKSKSDKEKRDADANGGKSSGDSSGFISDLGGTEFNIDDFLKNDSLPLLSNGIDRGDGSVMESRFSQWFKRDIPQVSVCDSNRSSAHEEMFNSMINDITETNVTVPNNIHSNSYFAPISPAEANVSTSSALMDMLRIRGEGAGDATEKFPSLRDLEVTGKLHSVGELEARIRQQQGGTKESLSNRGQTLSSKKEEELAAFKKLLIQASSNSNKNAGSASSEDKMSLKQMMSKAHAVPQCTNTGAEPQLPSSMMTGGFYQQPTMPISSNQLNTPNVPNDLVMKLLQVQQQVQQQDVLNKIFSHSNTYVLPPQIQHLVNNFTPTTEVLARPETQALLTSLKRGEISLYQVAEQLKKTASFQTKHKEILATVIKLHQLQTGSGIPPRTSSPMNPSNVVGEQMLHQLLLSQQQSQHQTQQLRIPSPLANAYCPTPSLSPNLMAATPNTLTVQHPGIQRVPSPRELVVHTQSILQSALIKKKLEEQKENFRKRQELQRSHSPNMSNATNNSMSNAGSSNSGDSKSLRVPSSNSPTPANLAFTPTSVLRKMTASNSSIGDKDSPLDPGNNLSSLICDNKSGMGESNSGHNAQQISASTWNNVRPVGRPIVKSSSAVSQPPLTFQPYMPPPSMDYMMNVPPPPSQYNSMPPRSKMTLANQTGSHYNNSMMLGLNRPQNYPTITRAQTLPAHLTAMHSRYPNASMQQLLMSRNVMNPVNPVRGNIMPDINSSNRLGGMHSNPYPVGNNSSQSMFQQSESGAAGGDGANELSSSPVSNQLARWFSPELLAQARAGQLPNMPPVSPAQNMLSVEELERLQQTVKN